MRCDRNLARTQFESVLDVFDELDWFATKTKSGVVLEYFCRFGIILRLRQKLALSQIIFVEVKVDLEFFVQREERRENWT